MAAPINKLLTLPFALKVCTQDWHPANHVSFAANHAPPTNNVGDTIVVPNPANPSETEAVILWPIHCVQDSSGAHLIPELDVTKVDHILNKGQDSRVEMFSAFKDSYKSPCVRQSNLLELLESRSIASVYVVGLATDYCVKHTAIHAAEAKFKTIVIEDATRAVNSSQDDMNSLKKELNGHNVLCCKLDEADLM